MLFFKKRYWVILEFKDQKCYKILSTIPSLHSKSETSSSCELSEDIIKITQINEGYIIECKNNKYYYLINSMYEQTLEISKSYEEIKVSNDVQVITNEVNLLELL